LNIVRKLKKMKNKILLLIITFLTSSEFIYCQNNDTTGFKSDYLIGVWIPRYNKDNNNLIFEKKSDTDHKYGLSIEFLKKTENFIVNILPLAEMTKASKLSILVENGI